MSENASETFFVPFDRFLRIAFWLLHFVRFPATLRVVYVCFFINLNLFHPQFMLLLWPNFRFACRPAQTNSLGRWHFQPNVRLSLLDTSSKFIERVHVSLEHFGQKSEKGTFLPWHRPNAGSGLTQTSAVDLQSEHHASDTGFCFCKIWFMPLVINFQLLFKMQLWALQKDVQPLLWADWK